MLVIKEECPVFFDVDDTLVLWENPGNRDPIIVNDPSNNMNYSVYPHTFHIEQLIKQKGRGFPVVVWSQAGPGWAENVVKALQLDEFVDIVIGKPSKYFDDLPVTEWIGTRLYFPGKA